MKHFFPFLTIILILCLLLHTSPIRSVSAQQHNSFASAKELSLDHSVSVSLPANATEYYYFTSLQLTDHTNQKYQIAISEANSLSISIYDDQGSSVHLKQTSTSASHWTGYIDNISDNTRFFLVLQNQTEQDLSISLSVQLLCSSTAAPKSSGNTQKSVTAKPDKKTKTTSNRKKATTQKPKKKSGQTSTPKTKRTPTPQSTTGQISDTKTDTPRPQNTSRHNSSPRTGSSPKVPDNSEQSSSIPKAAPTISGYPAGTETALPKYTPNNQNTTLSTTEYYSDDSTNHSRSNSILFTHFFRMSAGFSISAFELLSMDPSDREITLETLTPEKLSLQNNIIYAKTPGLAVMKIYSGNDITSCTIYIQESQEGRN